MSDDPFAEPSERRTDGHPAQSVRCWLRAPRRRHSPRPACSREARPVPKTGTNPLVAAASPLLAAAIRMSSDRGRAPDIDRLRRAMVEAMRRFETDALATGMDTRSLARRALCALRHGRRSRPQHALGRHLVLGAAEHDQHFPQRGDGRRAILRDPRPDAEGSRPPRAGGRADVSLHVARLRRPLPRDAAWRRGADRVARRRLPHHPPAPWRLRARAVAAVARASPPGRARLRSAFRCGPWVSAPSRSPACCSSRFHSCLANISDVAFAELFALPPRGQIAVPRPPLPAAPGAGAPAAVAATTSDVPTLSRFLAPEIKAGLVQVLQDAQTVTVRLLGRTMFGSGRGRNFASPTTRWCGRIGEALNDEPGDVMVNGYTDNQPIRTAALPVELRAVPGARRRSGRAAAGTI